MIRIVIIFFLTTFIWGEGTVNVDVDRRRINEGDSITLTVTTSNMSEDPEVNLPKMVDFKVVSGPSQSSSTNVQFINGKMTKNFTLTYTWTLIPIKTGQVSIPALQIKVGKQLFASLPITVTVSKRGTGQAGTKPQFFIEADVENRKPYRGQQVILTYILYTQVDVSSFDDELPKYKGFWTEELFSAKNLQLKEVQKNGNKYYAATIKKLALFPTRSGELFIDPLSAVIGIREKQQRWNNFSLFGPPSKKYTISTNRIKLDVQPLPDRENGEVSPIVGEWNMRSNISTINVMQDEAVTFQIMINGTGNIQAVDLSNISFPNELEVFEPKIKTKENPLRDKIGGEKIFEWVLIPRYPGEIIIHAFQLDYFDPDKQIWKTNSTKIHRLKVSPNEKAIISPIGLSKEEVSLVGKDIRFLDESAPKWRNKNSGLVSGTAFTLFFLSSIVFAFPHAHYYTRQKMDKTSGGRQAKRAFKSAAKILEQNSASPQDTSIQIYKAVITYINMKTNKNRVEYSIDEIMGIMGIHIQNEIYHEFEDILNQGEAVRFAPITYKVSNVDLLRVKALLKKIDDDWA